jgi:pre-mRNA-splicing factor CWC22
VFKFDPEFAANEAKYKEIKTEILGDSDSEEEESGDDGDEEDESDEDVDDGISESRIASVEKDETDRTI